jgi:Domain of unknown function (DUF4386)
MEWIAKTSSRPRARITGVVYLLYFLTAILAEVLGRRNVVYGDAANLVADALYIAVTVLFYFMFKPVNRNLSLLAACLSLAGCAIMILSLFHFVSPRVSPLLFFGPYCILIGYLILKSTFLPRVLGVLMVLAGLGWLIFLTPMAKPLTTYLDILGIVAEGALCLWLVVMGVNVPRWKEQAGAA